ncbi:MAG: 50S ribosomal protein L21 [Anaerolineales bacterium]|nr:50S ribosomal protein L21 [Anaerolineales bacterium]
MKYAIVESGGKQFKAVEGETIEVDRLPVNAGDKVGLERVLMLVDGEEITVGTPIVGGIQVSTTVMDHFKGPKLIVFKYSPKKRIRVKGGHRQQYTRLMVDVIGKPGETRKVAKAEKAEAPVVEKAEAKAEKKVEKKEATATSSPKGKKSVAKEKKAEKAPAKKSEKAPAKKTTSKKTTPTSSPKGKKPSSTKTTRK